MPEGMVLVCAAHERMLLPDPADARQMLCREAGCPTAIRLAPADEVSMPPSPMSPMEQTAVIRHMMLAAHVAAGFSRAEAMQLIMCTIQAMIMKGTDG